MNKIKWYISRLQTMSFFEIFYRGKQFAIKNYEKNGNFIPSGKLLFVDTPPIKFNFENLACATPVIINYEFFGLTLDLSKPIDFHLDLSSGKSFPKAFSKSINIRSDAYGSAKVVWEVNRLQFLVPWLISYKQNKKIQILDKFVEVITDWNNQNPYLKGVNWYSNIEINIRLINWYWCWLLLQDDQDWKNGHKYQKFVDEVWLPLIYQHCYYSYRNPSYYSSANNHLISEYAGLFIASCLWKFAESDNWLKYAQKGLQKEILLQHSVNGINKEEAAEYIQFITDFFLMSYITGKQHNIEFTESYVSMLENIVEYIHNILDSRGNFPKYGDEDDGRVILPDGNTHSNNFISILNTCAVLFNKPKWKRSDVAWDAKSALLTSFCDGGHVYTKLEAKPPSDKSVFYVEEGHFYFKTLTPQKEEIYAHFDAASLGFLSIAAHGHADALSFFLNLDGFPFLVDPGTFTYHTHANWRKYFVSTLAHNTISVNGMDQALLAGPTMWLRHFNTKISKFRTDDDADIVQASHDGYHKQKVLHTRTVTFDKKEFEFQIIDDIILNGNKSVEIQMPFHLHPAVIVKILENNLFELSRPGETSLKLLMQVSSRMDWEFIKSNDEGPLGWYSPSFMLMKPAATILGKLNISETISLQTILKTIL